jgi:hypothetical protein
MCLADAVGEERAEQIVLLDAVVEGVEKPAKDDVAPGLLVQGRLIAHRQPLWTESAWLPFAGRPVSRQARSQSSSSTGPATV